MALVHMFLAAIQKQTQTWVSNRARCSMYACMYICMYSKRKCITTGSFDICLYALQAGVIIGAVVGSVGGVLLLVGVGVTVYCCSRRQTQNQEQVGQPMVSAHMVHQPGPPPIYQVLNATYVCMCVSLCLW
jgi:hypothetical protein